MKTFSPLLLAGLAFSLATSHQGQAHDRTDWRTDREAFRSAHPAPMPRTTADPTAYPVLEIDPAYLKEKLAQLSGAASVVIDGKRVTIPERGGLQGRKLALRFLAQEYSALGFAVSTQDFSRGANFVAERKGSDPSQVLILSAHVDSVNNAGANDDGAGVIAGLAIAKALQGYSIKPTLRILAFDLEELGLVGAKAYVKTLKGAKEKILGDVHLEMMATNSRKDGYFHVIDCGKKGSVEIADHVMGAIQALRIDLKRYDACTDRSDHAAFWDAGIPAVVLSENFFGDDGDPCYHQGCDVLDSRLDFDYMARITRAAGSAVARMLSASLQLTARR